MNKYAYVKMNGMLIGLDKYEHKPDSIKIYKKQLKFLIKMIDQHNDAQKSGGYKNIRIKDALSCGYIRYIN